jgi:CRP-like cAMP-binding protein
MNILTKDKNEIVMEYGDEGDLFYFILSGEVEIRIP